MSDPKYTFDAEPNSYFHGSDLRVTETSTGETIRVNLKDDLLAFEVKDHTILREWPANAQAAAEKLSDDRGEAIYQGVQGDFWRWADETAKLHGFDGVFSAGRSGGWCAVDDTRGFDGRVLIDPTEGEEGDGDVRDRFLALAFEVERSIEAEWRPLFYDRLVQAAADTDYLDIIEPVGQEYGSKVETYLKQIAELCKERGMATEGPFDVSSDEYEWMLLVWVSGDSDDKTKEVSITVTVDEQREYEGDDGFGINFGLEAHGPDGLTRAELRPFNYSPQVWVDARDPEAVAERWAIFEGSDNSNLADLISKEAA